jgi:hypothetical protein
MRAFVKEKIHGVKNSCNGKRQKNKKAHGQKRQHPSLICTDPLEL